MTVRFPRTQNLLPISREVVVISPIRIFAEPVPPLLAASIRINTPRLPLPAPFTMADSKASDSQASSQASPSFQLPAALKMGPASNGIHVQSELSPYQILSPAGSAGGSPPSNVLTDPAQLQAELAAMRQRCAALEAQLVAFRSPQLGGVVATPRGRGNTAPSNGSSALLLDPEAHHARKVSTLTSGLRVKLSLDELASMHQIFELFDKDGSGVISAHDLQALHQKLGEPISDEEASDMVLQMGQDHTGIDFNNFCALGDGSHPSQRVDRENTGGLPPLALDERREKKRKWYLAKVGGWDGRVVVASGDLRPWGGEWGRTTPWSSQVLLLKWRRARAHGTSILPPCALHLCVCVCAVQVHQGTVDLQPRGGPHLHQAAGRAALP